MSLFPPALIVIFNHRFDENLPKLRALYGSRFRTIRFLVPFYDGDAPDVIPVIEDSAYHQGYLYQARKELGALGASHLVFIGDDVLLHPSLNESTIAGVLMPEGEDAYVKQSIGVESFPVTWPHGTGSLRRMRQSRTFAWESALPSLEQARANRIAHGLPIGRYGVPNLRRAWHPGHVWEGIRRLGKTPEYPLYASLVDLVAIRRECFAQCAVYGGVTAALGMHVEVGWPSAIHWACGTVATEASIGRHARYLWPAGRQLVAREAGKLRFLGRPDTIRAFEDRYARSVKRLEADLADDELMVHPVKLSRWNLAVSAPVGPA